METSSAPQTKTRSAALRLLWPNFLNLRRTYRTCHVTFHEGYRHNVMVEWTPEPRCNTTGKGRAKQQPVSQPWMPFVLAKLYPSALPHTCCYCNRTFTTLDAALRKHPVCNMWSCSFLPGLQYTIYPSGSDKELEAVCCYCNESLSRGNGKVKGTLLKEHVSTHNFRDCNQQLYFSAQQFRQHLQDKHRTSCDGTLFAGWTLLLKSSKKERSAVFESVGVSPKRAYTDPVVAAPKHQNKKVKEPPEPKMNFMDFSETPQFAPRKKIRRKASTQTMPDSSNKGARDSTIEFRRAATIDGDAARALHSARADPYHQRHKSNDSVAAHAVDAATSGLQFFRRRLDGSTRNRLYLRDETEGPLTKSSQKLFQKVPASTFGGLVLHSSLLAATPARLTNSVDIYTLR
jgi:hypothetical protein